MSLEHFLEPERRRYSKNDIDRSNRHKIEPDLPQAKSGSNLHTEINYVIK